MTQQATYPQTESVEIESVKRESGQGEREKRERERERERERGGGGGKDRQMCAQYQILLFHFLLEMH